MRGGSGAVALSTLSRKRAPGATLVPPGAGGYSDPRALWCRAVATRTAQPRTGSGMSRWPTGHGAVALASAPRGGSGASLAKPQASPEASLNW